ncbi:hypothetical protein HK100_012591 [Physocladia obscura]|uniref:Uncharacterized protein n=1 Tax=Physocladia obscura TaxID=109957 RepID=A0AAD5SZN1_9FUNG|nr:hypothetical protein HK100_012591 [Physocladia obscura]
MKFLDILLPNTKIVNLFEIDSKPSFSWGLNLDNNEKYGSSATSSIIVLDTIYDMLFCVDDNDEDFNLYVTYEADRNADDETEEY